MAKPNQSMLILDPPNELVFSGPFTEVVTSFLKLTNALDQPVCFKVKTTAPKMYCVRPNSGTIDPKAHVDVAIMLQPFDYETLDKTKHKFMVQSILAPQPPIDMEKLWKEADPNNIVNTKLKCMFEMPVDASANKQPASDQIATNVAPSIKLNPNYPVVQNEPQSQESAATLRQRQTLGGVKEQRNEQQHQSVGEKDITSTARSASKSRPGTATVVGAGTIQTGSASSALRERYIQHQAQNAATTPSSSIQHILQLFTSAPVIVSIIISLIVGMIVAKLFF